ncbi:MAG: hypothetical protein KGY80_14135 [Candidatus Thorarchaeota archaeon]|nr:hypothetical protein [Candidatus Thorarchaeota archaeon]
MGAASTSFLMGMSAAAIVCAVIIALSYIGRKKESVPSVQLTRRKPLFVAAIAYFLVWGGMLASGVLPISYYHGPNAVQTQDAIDQSYQFTVYSGPGYTNSVSVKAMGLLQMNETDLVEILFYNESGEVILQEVLVNYTDVYMGSMSRISRLQVPSGTYTVNITETHYRGGVPTGTDPLVFEISQALTPDHLEERFKWSTQLFLVVLGGGVFLLGGYAIDLGSIRKPEASPKPEKEKDLDDTYEEYLKASRKK